MSGAFPHFADRLWPVLYQLTPHHTLNLPRLEDFLRIGPRHTVPVFEFRKPSWYLDEVYALLERHGAAFCVHDMPGSASPRLAEIGRASCRERVCQYV